MAKFKLFQIHLTDAEIDLINEEGHDAVHKQSLKLDMNLRKNDTGMIAADAFRRGYYTHVSNITADTLEGVFTVGNMGPEDMDYTRYGKTLDELIEMRDAINKIVYGTERFKT